MYKNKSPEKLANQIIKELSEAGFDYDEMLEIIRNAREIYKKRRYTEKQKNCNHSMKYDLQTGGSTCTRCGWMS